MILASVVEHGAVSHDVKRHGRLAVLPHALGGVKEKVDPRLGADVLNGKTFH